MSERPADSQFGGDSFGMEGGPPGASTGGPFSSSLQLEIAPTRDQLLAQILQELREIKDLLKP